MSWNLSTLTIGLFGLVCLGLGACGQNAPPSDARPQKAAPATGAASADVPSADVSSADDAKELAAADQADKELIAKQKTCPVTDEPLGSMGTPVKVVVKGRTVFLCCAGCKKKLLADPDKYLKKLDEQK